jgi:type II secretory pathway pseudopilin PulG
MKKKAFTLLEIIIVIFLITLITGAIGYNMKGTLDKGRAFRTAQGIDQLHDLLLMCVAEGRTVEEVANDPVKWMTQYELARHPAKLIQDGWGHPLDIKANQWKTDFIIHSTALKNYEEKTSPKGSQSNPSVTQ